MQLMPSTAKDLSRRLRFDRRRQVDLFNPDISVELGGYYLRHLLKRPAVRGDLIRLIASYNGGPGNVRYWERRMKHGNDPLLFVEILPSLETRLFVRRVLTNLWIYRHRLGQPAPSMADVSKGRWPKYRALDGQAATPPLVRHRIPNRPG